MRKRNNNTDRLLINHLGLGTKAEKYWFVVLFALLCVYVSLVYMLQGIPQSNSIETSFYSAIISFPCIVILCGGGIFLLNRLQLPVSTKVKPVRQPMKWFFVAWVITVIPCLVYQIIYWPGALSVDSLNQLSQVLTGNYDNWHPVLHTWLFFTIPYKLFHSVAGIVTSQILFFGFAVAYLYHVLHKHGCNKVFMLISWVFIVFNPNTLAIMVFPWKDSALTIMALILFTHLVEIYKTEGAWLQSPKNLFAFAVVNFVTTGIRHNSILLVVPIFVVLFIFLKKARKQILFSALAVMILSCVMNGFVFKIAGVTEPGHRQVEMLGLPMTILSNVYMNERNVLSQDAIVFLERIATQNEWAQFHEIGNFNALKFGSSQPLNDIIEAEGAKNILTYTLEACMHSPIHSLNAVIELTDVVWAMDQDTTYTLVPYFVGNAYNIEMTGLESARILMEKLIVPMRDSLPYMLVARIGVVIMVFLFAGVANIGRGKMGRAFLILSPLAYNFGTMLLLTGEDFRFFHFNFVIVVPILYILMERIRVAENEIVEQPSI